MDNNKMFLSKLGWIGKEDELSCLSPYVFWYPGKENCITLDGEFTLKELKQIVTYIENFDDGRNRISSSEKDGRKKD